MSTPRYEEKIAIPLQSYSGASSVSSNIYRSDRARWGVFVLYVKTAGTSNLLYRISAISPVTGSSNTYVPQVQVTVTTTGVYVIGWGPGLALQPPGEAADTTAAAVARVVAIPLPDRWRFSIGKGDASAWEFGVSYRLVG